MRSNLAQLLLIYVNTKLWKWWVDRRDRFLPHNINKQNKYILSTDLMGIQINSDIAAINSEVVFTTHFHNIFKVV